MTDTAVTINVRYKHICRDVNTHADTLKKLNSLLDECISAVVYKHSNDPTDIPFPCTGDFVPLKNV